MGLWCGLQVVNGEERLVAKVSCPVSGSGHPDHAEVSDELRRCVADEKEAVKVVDSGMVTEGEISGLSFVERIGAVGNPVRAQKDSGGPSFGW